MPASETCSVLLCPTDRKGLQPILEKFAIAAEPLFDEIDTATIVPDDSIPSDIVRVNSPIQVQDLNSVERFDLNLVHADQIDRSSRQLSVTAPVGAALIGLPEGEGVEWPLSYGHTFGLGVLKVRLE
ncbi:MAG: regulator of nucleoside diphosphate kinase [Candidatus Azotimanducaceae bacterium]|jgi:regulator of nucleoside diphosphate kinase